MTFNAILSNFCLYFKLQILMIFKAQEEPPLPDVYKCAKCDFQHRSREDFQRHIKIHLSANSEDKQCTECGQSFASLSALEKHLFMSHKVN